MSNETSGTENGVASVDEKRAQFERMEHTVCPNGYVNVANLSHNDDSNHTYSVEVRNGEAVSCSCGHAVHRGAHCKHQISVEQNPIVLHSADAARTNNVATDGGNGRGEITGSEAPDLGGGEEAGPVPKHL
jgi:hypothetical protein